MTALDQPKSASTIPVEFPPIERRPLSLAIARVRKNRRQFTPGRNRRVRTIVRAVRA